MGNGRSLLRTPFQQLKNEVTFAVGRVNLLFNHTDWRPTNYVRIEEDGIDIDWWAHDMFYILNLGIPVYLGAGFRGHYRNFGLRHCEKPTTRIEWVETCDGNHPPGWHLPKICLYGGSLFVAIQLAVLQGYDPIYLVGCDLSGGHFSPVYAKGVQKEKVESYWEDAHKITLRDCPVRVYNSSIGGTLDVYERKSLWGIDGNG